MPSNSQVLSQSQPPITNRLFAMLNCRRISATEDVLVADYQVDCNSDRHKWFVFLAWTMIVCFSAAVPIVMMLLMKRTRAEQKKQFMTPEWREFATAIVFPSTRFHGLHCRLLLPKRAAATAEYITRQIATEFGHDNIREVRQCIIDVKLGNRYGFLVSAFKPGFFYW